MKGKGAAQGVLQISSDGDDRRIFLGRKTWPAFFLGCLDLSRDFFGYSKQSEDSDGMMNKQTQTFNFYCSFFFVLYPVKPSANF